MNAKLRLASWFVAVTIPASVFTFSAAFPRTCRAGTSSPVDLDGLLFLILHWPVVLFVLLVFVVGVWWISAYGFHDSNPRPPSAAEPGAPLPDKTANEAVAPDGSNQADP
ncbi:hypothetical protein [Roseateles sp. P5_D6]